MAPEPSLATRLPTKPPMMVRSRMPAMLSGVRDFTVTSPPITSSAFIPSSVICTARVLGVHREVTVRRSTPGMKNRAWVTS